MKYAVAIFSILGLVAVAQAQSTSSRNSSRTQRQTTTTQTPVVTEREVAPGETVVTETPVVTQQSTVTEEASAESTSTAALPRTEASPLRLAPVLGASSFANSSDLQTNRFGDGFSAGLFADFGSRALVFETGILTLSANTNRTGSTSSVRVNTWGVPVLAKWNLSGKPHETVFLKAGGMPFLASGQDTSDFNVLAVGGLGANIPLGRSSSILLDATYNSLFSQSGDLTNYQGLALLAGLSFNL